MNDVMQCLGTSAAEGKSTSDLPELFRQADLSAEDNLNPSFGDDCLSISIFFFFLQWIKAFDPFYPLAVIP